MDISIADSPPLSLDLPTINHALGYADRAWPVFPCHTVRDGACSCGARDCHSPGKHPRTAHGLKDATTDPDLIRGWWTRWPEANIAVATGASSGLIVLDVDLPHGPPSLDDLEAENDALPETGEQRTGSGGRQLFYRHPGGTVGNRANLRPGLDVRGDGGYVIVPDSAHASGDRYAWTNGAAPAPAPAWLLALITPPAPAPRDGREVVPLPALPDDGSREQRYATSAMSRELEQLQAAPDGARNDALNRAAFSLGQLVAGGLLNEDTVRDTLESVALTIGLHETETRRTIASGMRSGMAQPRTAPEATNMPNTTTLATHAPASPPGPPDGNVVPIRPNDDGPRFTLTELGNGERLVEQHGADLRYSHPEKRWYVWDGMRWQPDADAEVVRRMKATVRTIYAEAAAATDSDHAEKVAKFAASSSKRSTVAAAIGLAESEPGIPVAPDKLDVDPWSLTVRNGTVDLRTGTIREHRREDLLTKLAPVTFDPAATAPTWDAFLARVVPDGEVRAFLQRAVGYSLTGSIREHVLLFLYGHGANGKSTFLETIRALLGEFAQQAPPELLLATKATGGPSPEVARLRGARFVAAVETDDGQRFAESLVKQLTGGDRLVARYLHANPFEFDPTHKLWLATNHRPEVRGTDDAIWRRIRMVPFEVTIPEDDRDASLGGRLLEELDGILNWALDGVSGWLADGLGNPDKIRKATTAYRDEQDVIGQFLEERCVLSPGQAYVYTADLYRAYDEWCAANGERPLKQRALANRLKERGIHNGKHGASNNMAWFGVGLAADEALAPRLTEGDR